MTRVRAILSTMQDLRSRKGTNVMVEMDHPRWGHLSASEEWGGQVAVPKVHRIPLKFEIEAYDDGPHEEQFKLLGEVVDRYPEFWPAICEALIQDNNRIYGPHRTSRREMPPNSRVSLPLVSGNTVAPLEEPMESAFPLEYRLAMTIHDRDDLEKRLTSHLVYIGAMVGSKPEAWSFCFRFQDDSLGYFIDFKDWKIDCVVAIH